MTKTKMLKSVATMAVLSLCLLPVGSATAATNLRFAHGMGPGEVGYTMFQEFADNVTKRTNGEITFTIFPADQLGKESDTLMQAKNGAIDITAGSMAMLSPLVPSMEMVNAPFLWKDWDEARTVIDGTAFDPEFDELRDKHNLVPLTRTFYFGWRDFTFSNKEVKKPEDMKGLKVRVPENPLWVEMVKAIGAVPTPIPFSEVYTALQQKVVDGQENPVPTIQARKYFEVQKYLSVSKHMLQTNLILINKRSLAKLSSDDQKILFEEAAVIAKKNAELVQKQEEEVLAEFRTSGKITVIDDVDRDAFLEVVQSANEKLAEGRWGLDNYKRLRTAIEQYRSGK